MIGSPNPLIKPYTPPHNKATKNNFLFFERYRQQSENIECFISA